mmetsp:Transcript_15192/g.20970  ORF Transcript_15192/g.20970 Transcript_15192/m.20970 type:complete len:337 (-) Transcript_15192:99-1109(-)|eukprot:CAMPEP_0196583644 /NCGR_PEP_ID=MMETSP1081-20130531/44190_1 /TAXON_ID=36882 /ORGANISM="Pyramimonas amylifera, Strain CCMP720" /LENGTH=336 /DNA_ID=CAMNT_0041904591 /DNA_START=201 /DNA_END=1211 /DNA_ORIENTATION=-
MACDDVTIERVNLFLTARPNAAKDAQDSLAKLLESFVACNETPATSANFHNGGLDEMQHLIRTARHPATESSERLSLLVLKCFKILSRKQQNRAAIGEPGVRGVLTFLRTPRTSAIAGEGANVILNVCYEKDNVDLLLRCDGVRPLVKLLTSDDVDLQANAAGAIQSICFQEEGRQHVRDCGSIPHLLKLLETTSVKVRTRAAGAIHNMSSDPEAIRIIRRENGIGPLIDLLSDDETTICGSAAGALQNVSREVASRRMIRDYGAVKPLAALLAGTDLQAQVCAAGALLNILGPDLGEDKTDKNRRAFGKILTNSIVLGIAFESFFDMSARDELMA